MGTDGHDSHDRDTHDWHAGTAAGHAGHRSRTSDAHTIPTTFEAMRDELLMLRDQVTDQQRELDQLREALARLGLLARGFVAAVAALADDDSASMVR